MSNLSQKAVSNLQPFFNIGLTPHLLNYVKELHNWYCAASQTFLKTKVDGGVNSGSNICFDCNIVWYVLKQCLLQKFATNIYMDRCTSTNIFGPLQKRAMP